MGDEHCSLAKTVSPSVPADGALLQACTRLWAAADPETVAAAVQALLDDLIPGARVRVRAAYVEANRSGADSDDLWFVLESGQALVIERSTKDPHDHRLLDAIGGVIAARTEVVSRQAALTKSVEQLEMAERVQHALYLIADQASSNLKMTDMLRALHGIVGTLIYAENFYIALYDAPRESVRFRYYADSADPDVVDSRINMPMDAIFHSATWYVICHGKTLMGSPEAIGRQVDGPIHNIGTGCVDWLGVPLLRGGKVVGCVVVQSYNETHHYNARDKALLTCVAQHIQTALERRIAHAELEQRVSERTEALREANRVLEHEQHERQRAERLQITLFRIAEMAHTTDSIDGFFAAIHREIGALMYARNFYVAMRSDDGGELTFPYSVDERNTTPAPRKLTNGPTEYVLRHDTPLLANEAEVAALRAGGEVILSGSGSGFWLGVPLVCAERTVGVLVVQSYSPEHRYTLHDQGLLIFVSYHIAHALERLRANESQKRVFTGMERKAGERTRALSLANRDLREQIVEREQIEEQIKYDALHDSLTGLPNRTLLMQRVERRLQCYHADPSQLFAALFVDLDRFKIINDSVGYPIGDELLIQAGDRIRACLKHGNIVARVGGDEFCVLLDDTGDAATACHIAKRIINDLSAPFQLAAKELFTSASIGVVVAAPRYRHPEELVHDGDLAAYQAKAEGGHRYTLFDESQRRQAATLLEVENDLRRGMSRNEFVPYFQPIVRLASGALAGYEALMRWRHPTRGLLEPAEFLTVAEESGLSEMIDWQIFEQACEYVKALTREGTYLSINLSGRHFRNPNLEHRMLALLADHAVPAGSLRIEITEGVLLEHPPEVTRILRSFRNAGIDIALDDFGTGYSSLSYLHQYPLQSLKIDRSFIHDLTERNEGYEGNEGSSETLVRAILAMAEAMSMQVVAEGIETESQRETLQRLGCEYGQGFLFSRAQPAETWLEAIAPVSA